jgi:S-adenosylmethionine synthetase
MMSRLAAAECVAAGHPDKVADQISDAILDATLEQDPGARVAVEALVTKNLVVLAGEIRGPRVDYEGHVRGVLTRIGYTDPFLDQDFGANSVCVVVKIQEQSRNIADVVDSGLAGDQGTVYGYATDELSTGSEYKVGERPHLMPAPIHIARSISSFMTMPHLRAGICGPDGKTQVVVRYDNEDRPVELVSVLHSQHMRYADGEKRRAVEDLLRSRVMSWLHLPLDMPREENIRIEFFTQGGPGADTGLTGRKIIVDTYGSACPHGGGAFSGKDPSKVDRSGAYMARHEAKRIVRSGEARRALVALTYEFGVAEPVATEVNTFGYANDSAIRNAFLNSRELTPFAIRERLDLGRPIYRETAWRGHFGYDPFPWEKP